MIKNNNKIIPMLFGIISISSPLHAMGTDQYPTNSILREVMKHEQSIACLTNLAKQYEEKYCQAIEMAQIFKNMHDQTIENIQQHEQLRTKLLYMYETRLSPLAPKVPIAPATQPFRKFSIITHQDFANLQKNTRTNTSKKRKRSLITQPESPQNNLSNQNEIQISPDSTPTNVTSNIDTTLITPTTTDQSTNDDINSYFSEKFLEDYDLDISPKKIKK